MELLEIIDNVAKILNVNIHHFDHRKFPNGYLQFVEGSPIIVAYGGSHCSYAFAIMDDFKIVTDSIKILELGESINQKIGNTVNLTDEILSLRQIRECESYLLSNNVNVLKNFDPKKLTHYLTS